MDKIAIIGTGLIGTSLGLAIKRTGIKSVEIVGTDIERAHASKAKKMGAIDHVSGNLAGAPEDAEIVIIATPVLAIKDVMEIIAPRLKEGCLVTDTGGSKGVVLQWAEQYLPKTVSFVGGNPMVGKENTGPEAADGALFRDSAYCVIPSERARQDAVRLLTDMIREIGAKPYFIDVGEHDSFVSAVSHLPALLSAALLGCTSKSPSWDDIAKLASFEYKNLTSLSTGDPVTRRDITLSNSQDLIYWIDAFIQELYEVRQILVGDEDGKQAALEKVFNEAFDARVRLIAGLVTPASQAAANKQRVPSATEGLSTFLMGDPEARRRVFGWGGRRGDDSGERK